jgi:hypothetical protein
MGATSDIAGSSGMAGPTVIPSAAEGAGRRWAVIGLLSLGMIIAYASRSNLSVALIGVHSFSVPSASSGQIMC